MGREPGKSQNVKRVSGGLERLRAESRFSKQGGRQWKKQLRAAKYKEREAVALIINELRRGQHGGGTRSNGVVF